MTGSAPDILQTPHPSNGSNTRIPRTRTCGSSPWYSPTCSSRLLPVGSYDQCTATRSLQRKCCSAGSSRSDIGYFFGLTLTTYLLLLMTQISLFIFQKHQIHSWYVHPKIPHPCRLSPVQPGQPGAPRWPLIKETPFKFICTKPCSNSSLLMICTQASQKDKTLLYNDFYAKERSLD